MPHRNHTVAMRLHSGEAHRFREVFIWLMISLVLYVMIRFVLMDLVDFARLPAPPMEVTQAVPAAAAVVVVEPAASP